MRGCSQRRRRARFFPDEVERAISREFGTVKAVGHVEPTKIRKLANLRYLRRCTGPIL